MVVGLITCGGVLIVRGPSSSAAVRVVLVHDIKEEEGERQKEVQEAKGDEEKESEVDGEVGKRVNQRAQMTMRQTRRKLEPQCDQSCMQGTAQQTRTTLTTKNRHYKQTSSAVVQSTALTSLQLLFSWVSTCFRFAATLNMLLCLSLCIRVITSLVVNCSSVFPFSPVCEFLADFSDSHTAKTGLLSCCLYTPVGYSGPPSAVNDLSATTQITINKFVKAVRLRFYPKIEHNGCPRSIINLCMHPLSSTFFEFLGRPPGSTPLPPTGGRT